MTILTCQLKKFIYKNVLYLGVVIGWICLVSNVLLLEISIILLLYGVWDVVFNDCKRVNKPVNFTGICGAVEGGLFDLRLTSDSKVCKCFTFSCDWILELGCSAKHCDDSFLMELHQRVKKRKNT